MTLCHLALGANTADAVANIDAAIKAIETTDTVVINQASIYKTPAMGCIDPPFFCNTVIAIETSMSASTLLHHSQQLERKLGRQSKGCWSARPLDIDILTYGDATIREHDLIIPHPGISRRLFVLIPLHDIAPELILPTGRCVRQTLFDAGVDPLAYYAKI